MTTSAPRCAVGFDFDHTLGIDNKLERVAFLHLLQFVPRQELTLVQEIEQIDELLGQQRSGAFTIDEGVARFTRAHGADGDVSRFVERFRAFALDGVEEFVVPSPGVREMLSGLQELRVPTAILSNGWSPLQDRKAACVGFSGPVLVSDRIGCQKPDASAFQALVNSLGSSPATTWYVGDNPAIDIAGSTAAGLHGVWLDAEGTIYPDNLPRPGAQIGDLRELLTLVAK